MKTATNPCEVTWTFSSYGLVVSDPSLIPTCLLAAVVGLYGFRTISQYTNTRGSRVYSLSFLMFAFMMTDAMFVHCFLAGEKTMAAYIVGLIDVGLTSSIGLSFLYNGLVDVGILQEDRASTFVVMFGSYGLLFAAWIYSFNYHVANAFRVLYLGVILVGCGVYCITQLYALFKSGHWDGSGWLGVAGLSGGVGILAIFVNTWLCTHVSPFLSGEFWWFLLSDVAMWGILQYFVTHNVAFNSTTRRTRGGGEEAAYEKLSIQA